MYVQYLTLRNFRNYSEETFSPSLGFNILLGKNAQGKSSLLEAIYLLAMARSWHGGRDADMIQWNADQALVSAKVVREARNDLEVEVVLSRSDKKQIKVNTIRQNRLGDVVGQLNVVFISPLDGEIVRGEPSERRRFLNLEISQVQPQYCHLLVGYKRVIEQRNRLLKDLQQTGTCDEVLPVWNEQLVHYGAQIIERRHHFVDRLAALAGTVHTDLTDGYETLGVTYVSTVQASGTAEEIARGLEARLDERRAEEIRRGMSLVGPHRDDLSLTINGIDARTFGSHGQQRTIALSLRLAELELIQETVRESPIVLLDDVMTDLDEERRAHVFEAVLGRCQTFATTSTLALFDLRVIERASVFTVARGTVRPQ